MELFELIVFLVAGLFRAVCAVLAIQPLGLGPLLLWLFWTVATGPFRKGVR